MHAEGRRFESGWLHMRRTLIIAIGTGLLLGIATRSIYQLPSEYWWLARVGAPWLAVAFAVGIVPRRPWEGALSGAACLVAATLVYYAILGLVQHGYAGSPLGLRWLIVAVPSGLIFGSLGNLARRPGAVVPAMAALAVAFIVEAFLLAPRSGLAVPALLAAAFAIPVAMLRLTRRLA